MKTLVIAKNKVNVIASQSNIGKTSVLLRDALESASEGSDCMFITNEERETSIYARATTALAINDSDTAAISPTLKNLNIVELSMGAQVIDIVMKLRVMENATNKKYSHVYVDNAMLYGVGNTGNTSRHLRTLLHQLGTLADIMKITFIITVPLNCAMATANELPPIMKSRNCEWLGTVYKLNQTARGLVIAKRTNGKHDVGISLTSFISMNQISQTVNLNGHEFTKEALETALRAFE